MVGNFSPPLCPHFKQRWVLFITSFLTLHFETDMTSSPWNIFPLPRLVESHPQKQSIILGWAHSPLLMLRGVVFLSAQQLLRCHLLNVGDPFFLWAQTGLQRPSYCNLNWSDEGGGTSMKSIYNPLYLASEQVEITQSRLTAQHQCHSDQ